jgi:gluconokinase
VLLRLDPVASVIDVGRRVSLVPIGYHLEFLLDTLRSLFLRKSLLFKKTPHYMKNLGLRSPFDKVAGLVYFGRMVDQIRAHASGELSPEYQANLGKGLDEHCANFLGVSYNLVVEYVNEGLSDRAILQSCFGMGHRPSEAEIYMWNEFMRKRGWNDELSETLESQKKKGAMLSRSEIQTVFQFIDADEGRLVNGKHIKAPRTRKRVAIPAREWPSSPKIRTAPTPLKEWVHQENNGPHRRRGSRHRVNGCDALRIRLHC